MIYVVHYGTGDRIRIFLSEKRALAFVEKCYEYGKEAFIEESGIEDLKYILEV